MKIKFNAIWLAVIALGGYFIIRLINQAKMMLEFPLDTTNDYSAYIAHLFFLKTCGFMQQCPYWYHGFTTFKALLPGWYFFAYPLYWLSNNVLVATYASLILMFAIGLVAFFYIGKKKNIGIRNTLLFFLLAVANPIAIGNFIRLGRIMELFGWTLFFCIFAILVYYEQRKLDWKFTLMFIPLYAALFTSHVMPLILIHFVILGFILAHFNRKDMSYIILSMAIGFGIISKWFFIFLASIFNTSSVSTSNPHLFLDFNGFLVPNLIGITVTVTMLVLLWLHFREKKEFRFVILFIPSAILAILVVTRLITFVPILNLIYIDSYTIFFMFLLCYIFFQIKLFDKPYVRIGILAISIIFVVLSAMLTPWFYKHTLADKEAISLLEKIDGPFVAKGLTDETINSYSRAYYAYAAIYNNLTTPWGWSPAIVPNEVKEREYGFYFAVENRDCTAINKAVSEENATYIIAFKKDCTTLQDCGFNKVKTKTLTCLYKTNIN